MDPTVHDTSPQAAAVQRRVWQRMGPQQRLESALPMSDEVHELSVAGVQVRCPHLTRREALLTVVRRQLGDELFEAAFGR